MEYEEVLCVELLLEVMKVEIQLKIYSDKLQEQF